MSVDARISDALRQAVEDARQPRAVAERLLAWFEGLSTGNESLEDPDSVKRHMEVLFDAVMAEDEADGGGD